MQKEVIDPRIRAMKEGLLYREREPFGVRRKEFFRLKATKALLNSNFLDTLGHKPDGLIFQPINEVNALCFYSASYIFLNKFLIDIQSGTVSRIVEMETSFAQLCRLSAQNY